MTQTECKSVEVGQVLIYLGKKVKVDEILCIGTEYHPYYKLVALDKVSKSLNKMITKGHISYALCQLMKG